MTRRDLLSFNEAGMFPSQKWRAGASVQFSEVASMRPGCFHPRNHHARRGRARGPLCFNEAGMFPSQKSLHTIHKDRPRRSFNEAGMFPSQKSCHLDSVARCNGRLQ